MRVPWRPSSEVKCVRRCSPSEGFLRTYCLQRISARLLGNTRRIQPRSCHTPRSPIPSRGLYAVVAAFFGVCLSAMEDTTTEFSSLLLFQFAAVSPQSLEVLTRRDFALVRAACIIEDLAATLPAKTNFPSKRTKNGNCAFFFKSGITCLLVQEFDQSMDQPRFDSCSHSCEGLHRCLRHVKTCLFLECLRSTRVRFALK